MRYLPLPLPLPLLLLLAIFTFSSCTGNQKKITRKNLDHYYNGASVAQYFLAELPAWANFSPEGKCFRKTSVRYLDLKKVSTSYSLDYPDLIQFQFMFNERLTEVRKKLKNKNLLAKDEEIIFYDIYERIRGGLKSFVRPDYKRIHFIWIDDLLKHSRSTKLKKIVSSEIMNKGLPILISLCLSQEQMSKFVRSSGIADQSIRLISAEMFSPYNGKIELSHKFSLDFGQLFKKKQKLHFFGARDYIPEIFKGNFVYHKF